MFLLGHWKNFGELEENISLPELRAILEAARDREHRTNRFLGLLQGVDIDEETKEQAQEAFDRVQRQAASKMYGMSIEHIEHIELGFGGMEIEY